MIYSVSRDSFRDIRFEFNYSRSQFWFFHWLSLANPVLQTEITIFRFADEWGGGGVFVLRECAVFYFWNR